MIELHKTVSSQAVITQPLTNTIPVAIILISPNKPQYFL
jgi:hypothetical protein